MRDEYMRVAVFSSLASGANHSLNQMLRPGEFVTLPEGQDFLRELCRQIGARGDRRELASASDSLATFSEINQDLTGNLIVALLNGAGAKRAAVREILAAHADGVIETIITDLLKRSRKIAADESADPADRVAAVVALPLGEFAAAAPVLADLLAPRHPQDVQLAALAAFGQFGNVEIAPAILAAWPGMSPSLRLQAAELLLSRPAFAKALLAAINDGNLSPRDLDPTTIQRLRKHADATIRGQAVKLLNDSGPKRAEVVESYRDVLALEADAAHGREIFRKNCAICHRKEDYGTEVGADLATVVTRTPEALLISILDPNCEVDPKYLQYTVLTVDGLAKSGMIASETAASVTLKRAESVTETIPRADIEELQSTGMTLMPEGLEKSIDKQSLADLIAYLRQP
jgi:putative heme-binding domain-containing protein